MLKIKVKCNKSEIYSKNILLKFFIKKESTVLTVFKDQLILTGNINFYRGIDPRKRKFILTLEELVLKPKYRGIVDF